MARMVSAFCIPHTFPAGHPARLTPFAMWTVFPPSDYYGVSVPLRLAPVRESRVPYPVDVQDGLGALFVPFFRPLQTAQLLGSAANLARNPGRLVRASTNLGVPREQSDVVRRFRPDGLQFRHWGSANTAFTMPSGPCRTYRLAASRHSGFPDMLVSPTAFAFR